MFLGNLHSDLFYQCIVLFGVSLVIMGWAAYGVWKNVKLRQEIDKQRESLVGHHKTAEYLLQRAKHISTMAAIDQTYAVCDSCNRIINRYVRDEDGVTCIECAEKHTERE